MKEIKELMSKLEPCFGSLNCFEDDIERWRACPLEPTCANEYLKRHQKTNRLSLVQDLTSGDSK